MAKKTWKQAGLVMAVIGAASLAQAQQPGGGQGGAGNREEMMKKYDKDGDGKLSEAERSVMREEMGGQRGGKDAAKGPGGKSGAKGPPGGERGNREEMMKKFDADGDGELSETELNAMREAMGGQRGGKGPGGKGRGNGAPGQGGKPGSDGENREEMMKKYDTNGDGELSDEERAALREDMQKRRGGE